MCLLLEAHQEIGSKSKKEDEQGETCPAHPEECVFFRTMLEENLTTVCNEAILFLWGSVDMTIHRQTCGRCAAFSRTLIRDRLQATVRDGAW